MAKNKNKDKRTVTINPLFKAAIIVCGIMWLLSLIALLLVLFIPATSEDLANGVYETFEKIILMITGAFVGLLGGRAAVPDPKT